MATLATPTKAVPSFSLQWHITARCDQSCRHCYAAQSHLLAEQIRSELTLDACKQVVDSLVEFCRLAPALPVVNLTGGDPLLRKDVFELMEYAHDQGVGLRMMGNPFHLTVEKVRRMIALGVQYYQVSLDGMKAKHDEMRKPGSFDATVEGIRLLKHEGMKTLVMFTLSKWNASDLLGVMRLSADLGVDVFGFARYAQTEASGLPSETFTPDEYRALLLSVDAEINRLKVGGAKTRFSRKDHLWKLLRYEQGRLKVGETKQVKQGCHLGCNLNVLPDGVAYACRRFVSPVGRVPEQSILDIYVGDSMEQYRQLDKMTKCSKCPLLRHCRGCPAVAYGASGFWGAPDPQCWLKL